MAEINFDARNVDPSNVYDPIPPGNYEVQIIASEMKATKAGTGAYLQLEVDVLRPEYVGRKIWDRLTLQHSNAKTVEIAERKLSSICHALNKLTVENSEELHFQPMIAAVSIETGSAGYRDQNAIQGYSAINKPKPAGNVQTAKPSKVPPWKQQRAS